MILEQQNDRIVYSDGSDTEQQMLTIAKQYPNEESAKYIANDSRYTINNTFSPVRNNLLQWYPFKKDGKILEVGAGMGSLTSLLCDVGSHVTSIEMNENRAKVIAERTQNRKNLTILCQDIFTWSSDERFDYIVIVGVLEYAAVFCNSKHPFDDFLSAVKRFLKDDGVLLLAIENRFGLRYFCGAMEDHTEMAFSGLNDFAGKNSPRVFSKAMLQNLLTANGMQHHRFYGVMPDYRFPTLIYAQDYVPDIRDLLSVSLTYGRKSLLVADEQQLWKEIHANKETDFFANSFLVEASSQPLSQEYVLLAKGRSEVKEQYRIVTRMLSNDIVEKIPCTTSASEHLLDMQKTMVALSQRGVSCIPYHIVNNHYLQCEVIKFPNAQNVFVDAVQNGDRSVTWKLIELLKSAVLKSSNRSNLPCNELLGKNKTENWGIILENGYIDLTFYNAFFHNNELVFYDQEWNIPNIPLNYILYYAIKSAYRDCKKTPLITEAEVLSSLGIEGELLDLFDQFERKSFDDVFIRRDNVYGADGYYNNASTTAHLNDYYKNDIYDLHSTLEKYQEQEQIIKNNQGNIQQLIEDERMNLATVAAQEQLIANKEGHIEQLLESERALQSTVGQQVQQLEKQTQLMEKKENCIQTLLDDKHNLRATVEQQKQQIEQQKQQIEQQKQQLNNKEEQTQLLLQAQQELLQSSQELQQIKSSRSWRKMVTVWKVRDKMIPKGSKRRFAFKMAFVTLKKPIRIAQHCTPQNVVKCIGMMREQGVDKTFERIKECLAQKRLSEYEPIVVPQWETPQVSIVIPVYNQFAYTYACIQSIVQNSGKATYEILIGDDCSKDYTTKIKTVISDIQVIKNKTNLRFLHNCNHVAQYAKGEYILFLNNDTQVQSNWLSPLIDLMKRDATIGMVGSKLIYPDGRLQEAGGILWKDGSAWNYGNGADPNAPEYNYVKDVDYISGASIMIRHALWKEIGGFDERFAPAYCEDSDLAFEVRQRGYRVVYQPLSVVMHFEGVSNGTDTASGQKAYQVTNGQKFYDKWKHILQKEHFSNGENVFQARDRSGGKKTLLMVDHYVPEYDKDAGSRTVFGYLKMFAKQGYSIKFIGDNFNQSQPYTETLQQLGVEVLYGSWYAQNWSNWLEQNGNYIGYAFLNRPHITPKYIDSIREYTKAFVAYYGHDLGFLRAEREYQLTGNVDLLKVSQQAKADEFALMHKADVSYYPSSVEEELIRKTDATINVKTIPAYLFDDISDMTYQFSKRKDLMFIGGFMHQPNVDAMKWFAQDVAPYLQKLLPNTVVHVLGSHPPAEVLALEGEMIHVHGFVSDEELDQYYQNCRLSIVPLRYGAGIKGKVIESLHKGMPVVTTTIGAEGILEAQDILAIEDDAEQFARKIADLYQDEKSLVGRSMAGKRYIQEHFSPDKAVKVIGGDFGME